MTKKQRFWLQVIISCILLAVLVAYLDIEEAKQVLTRVQPGFVVLMFVIYAADRVLMAFKWNMLLKVHDNHLSLLDSVKLYYVSTFIGYLLPLGGVGPDLVRIYKSKEKGVPAQIGVVTIIVERILGLLATLLLTVIGGITLLELLVSNEYEPIIQGLVSVVVIGIVGVLICIFNDSIRTRLVRAIKLAERPKFKDFFISLGKYKGHTNVLISFLVLSVVENLFPVIAILTAGIALDVPLTFWYCLAVVPVATVLERLPISFAGIGLREGSYIVLFGLMGIEYAEALMVGVLNFFCFLFSLTPGLIWMFTEGVNTKEVANVAIEPIASKSDDFQ